jgi:NIPSNAP
LNKRLSHYCKFFFLLLSLSFVITAKANTNKAKPEFYQIKIYHFKDSVQEKMMDAYLQNALLPALHKAGVNKIGVFKVIANDTAADKMLYVFITLKSPEHLLKLSQQLDADAVYQAAGNEYINAGYKNPPYTRMESILLKAFPLAPQMQLPGLKAPYNNERIYELRSYESATEKIYRNKVQMFNEGGEITLFKRLEFNAVFYAEVISGSHMPNLMYMTSFENKVARDAHWKTFGGDPEWKRLSSMPEYQNNVSHIDITFLRAAAYSDF